MDSFHKPVLLDQVIKYLNPKPGDVIIDGTLGGGGHTEKIAQKLAGKGKVIGIDLDPLAIETAKKSTEHVAKQVTIVQDNFKNLKAIARKHTPGGKVDGILLDLGLSSGQLNDEHRGFSFTANTSLDMRFSGKSNLTAEYIVNTYSEEQLTQIFKQYGEERLARPIAKKIILARTHDAIITPQQLSKIVEDVYRKYYKKPSKTNPATKIFQALRIEVNQELENLKTALPDAISILKKSGRLVIISYHSLEDKIVKEFFKKEKSNCICPPQLPVCVCGHKSTLKILTRKPVVPTEKELAFNTRSRSAKLRAAEKI